MRLIDADELKVNMPTVEDEYRNAHKLIDEAETIEAIPVEFIEKHARLSDDLVALFGIPAGILKNVYRSLIDEWRSGDGK